MTDARRILAVQALRAFAYGLGSVLIGVSLARRGLSGVEVGGILSALLAGAALVSLRLARRARRRRPDAPPYRLVPLAVRVSDRRRGGAACRSQALFAGRGRRRAGGGTTSASPPLPRDRLPVGRAVCARLARRRLRRPGLHRVLVLAEVRHLGGDARPRLLRRRDPPGPLVPGSCPLRRAVRLAADDGLHPPAVEPPARRRPAGAEPECRDRAPARALRPFPDGRAGAAGVCGRRRRTERADRRGRVRL